MKPVIHLSFTILSMEMHPNLRKPSGISLFLNGILRVAKPYFLYGKLAFPPPTKSTCGTIIKYVIHVSVRYPFHEQYPGTIENLCGFHYSGSDFRDVA